MSVNTLPFAPPVYDLNDGGFAFWPPECHFETHPEEWPFVAEAWEKWRNEAERRKVKDRQRLLRCEHKTWIEGKDFVPGGPSYRHCGAEGVGERWARDHGLTEHPGESTSFNYVHARWVYEMMGFEDLWDGRPTGWRNLLDPRDLRVQQWETDVLELGTVAADYLWNDRP